MALDQEWVDYYTARLERMSDKVKEIRERVKEDLYSFAILMNPGYMYGEIHKEIFKWLEDYTLYGSNLIQSTNKLIMLPRGHLKSHMVAVWSAWIITRHPEVTILYISATSTLAEAQLYAIKNILTSKTYQRYFPEYVNPQEGKREAWASNEIIIDHPKRFEEGIRDSTIAIAGLTTTTTGWHADILVADDLVVPENAYTIEGRESVKKKVSQFTSILNAGGYTLACGTRYHPDDIYGEWKNQKFEVFDAEGKVYDEANVWEIKEYVVEEDGEFLWPRVVRPSDGKFFGFNNQVLAIIKAQYVDKTQFYAQYYNNPNDESVNRISYDKFQYYDKKHLNIRDDKWYFKDKRLNVYAAIDFAYTINKKSDNTAIVVIGIDYDDNIYILDIDAFKTDKIAEYFERLKRIHAKWNFNKLRAEVTAAQSIIVRDIKDTFKKEGLSVAIDEYRPTIKEGSKAERISATLDWRYDRMQMWHFKGGFTDVLEDELVKLNPKHDDLKDALASAVSIAVKPKKSYNNSIKRKSITFSSRFGGVSFK